MTNLRLRQGFLLVPNMCILGKQYPICASLCGLWVAPYSCSYSIFKTNLLPSFYIPLSSRLHAYTVLSVIGGAEVQTVQLQFRSFKPGISHFPSLVFRFQTFTNKMADTVDFSIAVRPNDLEAVPGIVKGIVEKANALSPGDETARHALLIQARSLVQALETPRETMTKHTWAQVRMALGKLLFWNLSNLNYYEARRGYRFGHRC